MLEAGGALGGGYYLGGGGVGGKLADKSGVFTVSNGGLPGEGGKVAGVVAEERHRQVTLLNNFTSPTQVTTAESSPHLLSNKYIYSALKTLLNEVQRKMQSKVKMNQK